MPKNTKNRRMINKLPHDPISTNSPKTKTLPFNGTIANAKIYTFSFASFDRNHKLFNLGDDSTPNGVIQSNWFLDFLDCLKSVSNTPISTLRQSSTYDLHPVNISKTNARECASDFIQYDLWQFRINKSKGRVIGFYLEGVFYIVWIDPHHNLTDSEGYGKATYHRRPQSEYEMLLAERDILKIENQQLQRNLQTAEELLS